ncbi:hypothetical protein D0T66_09815 [Dysgonomonas sp. 25]|nr:hypothetical protein [Dysgonomonas sp. 25]
MSGCIKTFLIALLVGFLVFVGVVIYAVDYFSSGPKKRREAKINKELAKEEIPLKYQSYQYLYETESSDAFSITIINRYCSSAYLLPDSTLILNIPSHDSISYFYKINTSGNVTGIYKSNDLHFYGTSLMGYIAPPNEEPEEEDVTANDTENEEGGDHEDDLKLVTTVHFVPPVIRKAETDYYYSDWPLTGDTALHRVEYIGSTGKTGDEIYDQSDIVLIPTDRNANKEKERLMHYNGSWYMASCGKEVKNSYKSPLYKLLEKERLALKYSYKKQTRYYRSIREYRIGNWNSRGTTYHQPEYWDVDYYFDLKAGQTLISFKVSGSEEKREESYSLRIYNLGKYFIIEAGRNKTYLVRLKK